MRPAVFRPDPAAEALLASAFPRLDLGRVEFRLGLPWFLRASSWVRAITLPHAWRSGRTVIHFRERPAGRAEDLALLAHECFHALQVQEAREAWRIPWPNPFLTAYLASWSRYGYRLHPLEVPAYEYDARFLEWADREGGAGPFPPELVVETAGFAYRDGWLRLLPAGMAALGIGLLRPLTGG